jgi:hypothetical protein
MRLEPFYTVRFRYPDGARSATINGDEQELFFLAEGHAEGRLAGRFIGANHPHRTADGTYRVNLQGAVETAEGTKVLVDYRGYGRAQPAEKRQVVGAAWHFSDDARYRRLNDGICVIVGEVRRPPADVPQSDVWIVLEIAELIWEPLVS